MKTIYKLIFPIIAILSSSSLVSGQNDNTIEFEPIHSTFLPSDKSFLVDEKFGTNSSVYFVGDELMLQSSKKEAAAAIFALPINPFADFTVEFSFNCPSLNNSSVNIGASDIALSVGFKSNVYVFKNQQQVFSDHKWKIPEG
ncbi:MAG: hypothetical protein K2M05_04100, partial [Paramuribaculum sp.]|nr:hypothetical protein [Paramuribaculum sp.]